MVVLIDVNLNAAWNTAEDISGPGQEEDQCACEFPTLSKARLCQGLTGSIGLAGEIHICFALKL